MKTCLLCKQSHADKDIAFMAITMENEEVHFCIYCLAKQAEKPFGISISMCDDNFMPIQLPTMKHIGIAKEFINPQNDGSAR